MRVDRIPPWPAHHLGRLLEYIAKGETQHHTLALQYYEVPVLDSHDKAIRWTKHDYDIVKAKPGAPAPLAQNEEWEKILEEPEVVGQLNWRMIVRSRYRHKRTGAVASREAVLWRSNVMAGGAMARPVILYPDGSKALLYIEEWRVGQNKVVIGFPDGMIDYLPDGRPESPITAVLRELGEEGGIKATDTVTITITDQWQKPHSSTSAMMGQDAHIFRVLIHGLQPGFEPVPNPESDELIKIKLVPINGNLRHHFDRYTEDNGYLIKEDVKEEIDRIMSNLP